MLKRETLKVYIYPDTRKSTNDYIVKFHSSFQRDGYKLNNRFAKLRLLNILFNLDSDVFIINWVDVLPYLRFGNLQYYFLRFILRMVIRLDKRVIWVLHNKTSHRGHDGKSLLVEKLMEFMAKYSAKVLVHAEDGITFYNDKYGKTYGYKAIHIPHPVYLDEIIDTNNYTCEWDFIIWGKLDRYKKVAEFLQFCKESCFLSRKKILICGKCDDSEYEKLLLANIGENMSFINRFVSNQELYTMICKSKAILFTYGSETVLSSGALIYSLNFAKPIIAPYVGNFKDLSNFVHCYQTFEDIEEIIKNISPIDKTILSSFLKANSWQHFPERLLKTVNRQSR